MPKMIIISREKTCVCLLHSFFIIHSLVLNPLAEGQKLKMENKSMDSGKEIGEPWTFESHNPNEAYVCTNSVSKLWHYKSGKMSMRMRQSTRTSKHVLFSKVPCLFTSSGSHEKPKTGPFAFFFCKRYQFLKCSLLFVNRLSKWQRNSLVSRPCWTRVTWCPWMSRMN